MGKLVQAKAEDLEEGKQLFFRAGSGMYRVEAQVKVINKPTAPGGCPVVEIIEVTQRNAGASMRMYAAGKQLNATPEELFVEVPDADS